MAVSEESAEESVKPEAETGFGTGLRGKLEKRQEVSAEAPARPSSNGAPPQHEARPGEPEAGGIYRIDNQEPDCGGKAPA